MADVDVGVRAENDDTYTAYCGGVAADPCGKLVDGQRLPWASTGWPEQVHAAARARQHRAEHEANLAGGPPQPLQARSAFLAEHGLAPSPDRDGTAYVVPDDEKVA